MKKVFHFFYIILILTNNTTWRCEEVNRGGSSSTEAVASIPTSVGPHFHMNEQINLSVGVFL